MDSLKTKKNFVIYMGYFSDMDDGPHTTLRSFIRIIQKYYNVIIIGFAKNKDLDSLKYWQIGNSKIILLKNYLSGHYYLNFLIFLKTIIFLNKAEFFLFNGIWYSYLPILSIFFKLLNKKYVICPHGGLNAEKNISIFKSFYYRFFIDFILKNSFFVQISSPLELGLIKQNRFLKFKNFKYKLLPNTISINNQKSYLNDSYKNFAFFIGRVHPIKDLEFLINAWYQLNNKFTNNNLLLLIAGQGDDKYTKKLKKIVDKKGIRNIKFLGKISHYDKISLIKNAKFTTITSHTEALPTTIIESLALSTPVLSTLKLGMRQILIKESVLYVEKDCEKFADKVWSIFNMQEEHYKDLKRKSYVTYEKYFSYKAIAKLVKKYYL